MLRTKELSAAEQIKTTPRDFNTENPAKTKLTIVHESESPKISLNENLDPQSEDFVKKAQERFLEANQCLKDKNYNFAFCQYTNTISNAFLAIENNQNNTVEMFKLIDKTIRILADFATENNEIYKKCQDDAKIKFCLTYIILSKDPKFNEHLPVISDPEYAEKTSSLKKVLREKRDLLINLIENEKDSEIAELYNRATRLTLKELFDHSKQQEHSDDRTNPHKMAPHSHTALDKKNSVAKYPGIFASPVKTGLACIIPGASIYSMANAGVAIVLWGGFYAFIAGSLACYAGNKLAEHCLKDKTNKPKK